MHSTGRCWTCGPRGVLALRCVHTRRERNIFCLYGDPNVALEHDRVATDRVDVRFINGCFHQLGVHFLGILRTKALVFWGLYSRPCLLETSTDFSPVSCP